MLKTTCGHYHDHNYHDNNNHTLIIHVHVHEAVSFIDLHYKIKEPAKFVDSLISQEYIWNHPQ